MLMIQAKEHCCIMNGGGTYLIRHSSGLSLRAVGRVLGKSLSLLSVAVDVPIRLSPAGLTGIPTLPLRSRSCWVDIGPRFISC